MKKASIVTYGCQMNVNESAKICKILGTEGYVITEDIEEADVVFLNTCTVRDGAATQIYGKLGELKRIKDKKGLIIGITGCFAQEMGRELIKKFPMIDIVMGNQNIEMIPKILKDISISSKDHVVLTEDIDRLPTSIEAGFDNEIMASVAITYGCNNFCTYCIVPYVRGRERSVPMEDILKAVEKYVKNGHKEIMLLGQNVNSYGKGLKNGENFSRLLENICKIDGDFIVRFISPHPRDFTDDVIDVIRKNEKIARALHLPLQSGSTEILKAMNRGYTKEQYLTLAQKIKDSIPGVALSTDVIVGFPGETEKDFEDTLDVIEKIKFETAFMFMYSVREGTKAATMVNQIDQNVKKDRLQRLIKLQNKSSLETSQDYMGHVVRVLVEGKSKKSEEMFTGRTSTNKIVLFSGKNDYVGNFVDIKINRCNTWTLYGDIV